MGKNEAAARPAQFTEAEWSARCELAACYQLFDHHGWTEMIFNHISLRLPSADHHYLINPYGLNYDEVTASNLVKTDLAGQNVEAGPYRGNPAGFAIHGAVHAARTDAMCVIHTHTTAGMAVSGKSEGLRHDDFYGAIMNGQIAYHDFEGVTVRADESERLVRSIGTKNYVVLRNHGLLVLGADVPTAFFRYWQLQRACEVQVAVASMGGADRVLPEAVRRQTVQDAMAFATGGTLPRMFFDAAVRRMERARANVFTDWRV
jgi:ribulose-5-phosphate 4-epimerase/fuculose-1-phosphate aldolase